MLKRVGRNLNIWGRNIWGRNIWGWNIREHLGLDLWKSGYKKGVPNPTRLRLGLGGCSFMDFSLCVF